MGAMGPELGGRCGARHWLVWNGVCMTSVAPRPGKAVAIGAGEQHENKQRGLRRLWCKHEGFCTYGWE